MEIVYWNAILGVAGSLVGLLSGDFQDTVLRAFIFQFIGNILGMLFEFAIRQKRGKTDYKNNVFFAISLSTTIFGIIFGSLTIPFDTIWYVFILAQIFGNIIGYLVGFRFFGQNTK